MKMPLIPALITLALLNLPQTAYATSEQAADSFTANIFVDYWNSGDSRAEQNEKLFTQEFIERRSPAGLARIMDMVYGDNGDIAFHSISSSNNEQIRFLASSQKGNWLEITLDLAPDQKIAGLGIFFTDAPPEDKDQGLRVNQIAARLGQYMDERSAKGEFSGAILLAKNGKPLFAKAYGLADIESGRKNTLDTPINLGSMNKMFTGLAITQLVARGKLAFTDTVGKYLPDYPNKQVRDEVTVHQLLTHTSGLGSYWTEEYERRKDSMTRVSDFAEIFATDPLGFEPGSEHRYSNSGPVVLGLIIEAISGESYYDYIRKNIYAPAGMTHSDHYTKLETASGKARGYYLPRDGASTKLISNQSVLGNIGAPAGGGYASANDLLKFATALYDGTLIDAQHREQMTTVKVPGGGGGGYAYLYQDGRINGHRYVGHNGGAPGINADFAVFPDSGYMFIVLSNTNHNASPVADQLRQWIGYANDL